MRKIFSLALAAVFAIASMGALAASHGGTMKDEGKMDCKMDEKKMDDKMKAECKKMMEGMKKDGMKKDDMKK